MLEEWQYPEQYIYAKATPNRTTLPCAAQSEVASIEAVEGWPERLRKGAPPPPAPKYKPPSAIDRFVASEFF